MFLYTRLLKAIFDQWDSIDGFRGYLVDLESMERSKITSSTIESPECFNILVADEKPIEESTDIPIDQIAIFLFIPAVVVLIIPVMIMSRPPLSQKAYRGSSKTSIEYLSNPYIRVTK